MQWFCDAVGLWLNGAVVKRCNGSVSSGAVVAK